MNNFLRINIMVDIVNVKDVIKDYIIKQLVSIGAISASIASQIP